MAGTVPISTQLKPSSVASILYSTSPSIPINKHTRGPSGVFVVVTDKNEQLDSTGPAKDKIGINRNIPRAVFMNGIYHLIVKKKVEFRHHAANLYIKSTEKNKQLIDNFNEKSQYPCEFIKEFTAKDGTGMWLELEMEYDPFWDWDGNFRQVDGTWTRVPGKKKRCKKK